MPVDVDEVASSTASDPFDDLARSEVSGDASKVSDFTYEKKSEAGTVDASESASTTATPQTNEPAEGGKETAGLPKDAAQVVDKVKEVSTSAYKSVVKYEQEHQLLSKLNTKLSQSARFLTEKVKECTHKDTTAPTESQGSKTEDTDTKE